MNGFIDSFTDPHARHAILSHLPIVLGALGFLPVAAWLATRMKNRATLITGLVMFALASAGAFAAAQAGEAAQHHLSGPMSVAAETALERHEELGESGWLWPLAPFGALAVAGLIPARRLRATFGAVALAAALGVAGWVALTAHEGGNLVYVHGVGVPAPGAQAQAAPDQKPAVQTERERDHDDR